MIEIRPAALREFALLPFIEAEADAAFAGLDPAIETASFPAPGTAGEFAEAFHIMVAGRPPVGFVRLEIVDGQAHVAQLAVHADHARKGIGRALLVAAKAWAQEAGFRSITLTTFKDVPFNAPFYATCGFTALAPGQWGAGLAAIRRQEQELGLDGAGPRIAMVATLGGEAALGEDHFRRPRHA
ncbi:GNAT family N-acetyltransferase [Arthrobacter sp. H35-D1]|uniref:GNAT family N-acetyltransferase n=1 Tax=Arthrobacter sp. H35-D1 TaxID=3046202 RepID=UPI0024B93042|nr:GNAT family N-acetyltransferase [Arthrobacter sp. H35-D1]MDJ0313822.1 GNAT family N-acetyltransferase [Arthrobacter sp. H35-D1]